MVAARTPRIVIAELPPVETLSEAEAAQILGAGRDPFRSWLRVEGLEDRRMLSVTPTTASAVVSSSAVSNILDTKVIAFDATTTGSVSYNLSTGAYSANVELPGGAKLDTTALKTLMQGQLALPKIQPVQAITAFAGLKTEVTTNYDEVKNGLVKQYGGGNVYVSTERFTDWASPENAAATIGTAVLTGGNTAGQIIQEAKDVILGELGNIYTWVKGKAPQEAEAAIAAILKGIVSGQDVESPYIALKFLNVNEKYTIGLGGAAGFIADGLGAGSASQSITAVHKGFAIIWKGSGDSLTSLTNSLNAFDGASLSGKSAFSDMIGKLVNRPELKGLGKVAEAVLTSNPSAAFDQFVTTKLTAALGLTPAQLKQLYTPGNPTIDLRATQLDEQLGAFMKNLAAGNEGSAKVTKLTFDLNTYEITAEVSLHHRHSWGSVSDILAAVGKKVGEWADTAGNAVKQKLDAAGNTVREVAYKAADKVTEVFDKAGTLIKKTIVNSAGYKVLDAAWNGTVKTLEVVRDAAGKLVSEYWRDGTKEFRNLYTDGVRTAYTAWENSVNTVHYVYTKAGDFVSKYWVDGAKKISQWYTNGKIVGENIVQGAVTIAQKTWDNGVKTLDIVRDAAGKLVSEYWKSGNKEFRNLYTNGVRTAYTAWENGVNTVNYVWNTAGDYLSKYWVDGANKISQWYTNGKITAENIVQGTITIAQKTWDNGVKTLDIVRDAAGKLVSEYWKSGNKEFRNLYTNGVRIAYTVWENSVNTLHYVWTTTGDSITKYWVDGANKISQWYTNGKITAENIVQGTITIAQKTWKDGINTLNIVRDTAGKLVSEYWRDGNKEFRNLYTNGIRTTYTVWENGVNTINYIWTTSGQKVSEYWRDGVREYTNLYRDGVRVAQNVWENGKNIARYVWENGNFIGDALASAGGKAKTWLEKNGIKF